MMHPRGELCVVGMHMIRADFSDFHPIGGFLFFGMHMYRDDCLS